MIIFEVLFKAELRLQMPYTFEETIGNRKMGQINDYVNPIILYDSAEHSSVLSSFDIETNGSM